MDERERYLMSKTEVVFNFFKAAGCEQTESEVNSLQLTVSSDISSTFYMLCV